MKSAPSERAASNKLILELINTDQELHKNKMFGSLHIPVYRKRYSFVICVLIFNFCKKKPNTFIFYLKGM